MKNLQEQLNLTTKGRQYYTGTNYEFDFDDIVLQKEYSYDRLCDLLGVPREIGFKKTQLLQELKKYCICEQVVDRETSVTRPFNNYKIYSIFKTPKEIVQKIKFGSMKQFKVTEEDSLKEGVFAVVLHQGIIIDHTKAGRNFIEEFMYLMNHNRYKPSSPSDALSKDGKFIILEVEGEDYNPETDTKSVRVDYCVSRLKTNKDYIVMNNSGRTVYPRALVNIRVPKGNHRKIMNLLKDSGLI